MIGGIMQRVRRSRMTVSEKAAIGERWKRGESLSEIGRAIGRIPGAVFHVVGARGGVPPAPRSRSSRALTVGEREEISRGLAMGVSFSQIGVRLGRPTSTVSREVGRHGGRRWYRAAVADADTWDHALRPQLRRLAQHPALRARVAEKLEADWLPQQIAGWLKRTYPKDADMQVSHETIYLSLFVQSRGVLKQALIRDLRRRKPMRR
jgi:IS30 family transposase